MKTNRRKYQSKLFLYYAVCIFLLLPQTSFANEIFQSGFEEGTNWRNIWDDYDGNPETTNQILTAPGPFNQSGNHVMRLYVPPGRGGADLIKVLPSSYDKMYLRWYQKWENGYNFGALNHGSGLHAGSREMLGQSGIRPSGNDYFQSILEPLNGRLNLYSYYRGMYQDCADPNGSCWGDHFPCFMDEGSGYCTKAEHRDQPGKLPPQLMTERWYCLEMMIDGGTPVGADDLADGVQNFWIDGIEYGPFNHLWHRTTSTIKVSIVWMQLFHHDSTHTDAGILLDDIVVSTERIGCSQISTNKVPSPPQNLLINQ